MPGTFEGAGHFDSLTWQLDGNEATASAAGPICEVTTPTVTPSPSPSPSPTATFTPTPPPQQTTTTTIDYSYDPLYRLVEASYDDGQFFRYEYDAVGNRLTAVSAQQSACSVEC